MMKVVICIVLFFLSACQTKMDQAGFYFPPEWEEQTSVWLGWSADSTIQDVQLQMAKALEGNVGLTILSRSDSLLKVALNQFAKRGIDTAHIVKVVHYIPNLFIRDAGPRFLKNKKNEFAIADFAWNNYGYPSSFQNYQFSNERGEQDNTLANQNNWKVISSHVVIEGGAIDVSSDMLICFKETAVQRNPGLSLSEIEQEYLRVYGKKKMLWLNRMPFIDKVGEGPKAGNYFGYGANGHTDEFVRFANDSTILIGLIDSTEKNSDPVSKADYEILKENYQILLNATDVQGKPFRIITLPVPSYSLFTEEETLTAFIKNDGDGKVFFQNFKVGEKIKWLPAVSYLNFFISNKVVLVAKYWEKDLPESERLKDEKVKIILQELFPERKIIQINPIALNRNGGGMHCATQQQPK
ncbi:MAG: agmatine deiminase family protein [Ginsengibacter sp.]